MLPSLLKREESLKLSSHQKPSLFHVAAGAWKSNSNLKEGDAAGNGGGGEGNSSQQLSRQVSLRPHTTAGTRNTTKPRSNKSSQQQQLYQTEFEAKVDYLKKRPKGWVTRFASHVDETHEVLTTPRTKGELRELRIQESGWQNTTVSEEELKTYSPKEPKPVVAKTYFGDRSELCLYCSRRIPVGAELVNCRTCPAISHVNCIPNVREFKKDKDVIEKEQRLNPWSPMNLSRSNSPPIGRSRSESPKNGRPETPDNTDPLSPKQRPSNNKKAMGSSNSSTNHLLKQAVTNSVSATNTKTKEKEKGKSRSRPSSSTISPTLSRSTSFSMTAPSTPRVAPTIVSRELDWTCHFCRNECLMNDRVNIYKHALAKKYYHKMKSIILVQSLLRMIPHRIQYQKAKRGITLVQRTLRAKWFARKAERERANQRYSYRIRLHDIKVVTRLLNAATTNANTMSSTTGNGVGNGTGMISSNSSTSGGSNSQYSTMKNSTTGIAMDNDSNNNNCDVVAFPKHNHASIIGDIPYEKYEKHFFLDSNSHHNRHGGSAGGMMGLGLGTASGYLHPVMSMASASGPIGGNMNVGNGLIPEANKNTGNSLFPHPSSANNNNNNKRKTSVMSAASNGSSSIFSEFGMQSVSFNGSELDSSTNNHNKNHPLLDFLQHGHSEDPQYAKPFKGGHNIPKGSLFLTVTIHEYEDQPIDKVSALGHVDLNTSPDSNGIPPMAPVQMFRYDFQLKDTGRVLEIKPSVMKRLGFHISGTVGTGGGSDGDGGGGSNGEEEENSLSPELIEQLSKHYQISTYNTSKPYILIPYTRANVEIRLTLSEVKDWPKSVVLGQSRFNVCYHLTRRKVVSVHQSMTPIQDDCLLPESDESTRLTLMLPLRPKDSKKGIPSYAQANRTIILAKKEDNMKQIAQSIFTWTVMAQGPSDWTHSGTMNIVHEESAITNVTNLSKYWCVLLEGYLHTFHAVRDGVRQKHCLDIRQCYVSILPDSAFRLKSSTETMFFVCEDQTSFDTWFKKIYTQCLSQHSVPYASYIKRNKPNITNHATKKLLEELQAAEKKNQQQKHASQAQDSVGTGAFTAFRRDAVFGTLDPQRSTSSRVWIDMMEAQIEKDLVRERAQFIVQTSKNLPDFVEPSLEIAKKKAAELELIKSKCASPFATLSRNNSGKFRSSASPSPSSAGMMMSRGNSERGGGLRVEAMLRASSGRFEASTSAAILDRFVQG